MLFVDGSNWYHSLRKLGLTGLGRLDYALISNKLGGSRDWIATRYYVGRVRQTGNLRLYASQRRFLAALTGTDHRISYHLGRLEPRSVKNAAAAELKQYLNQLPIQVDRGVYRNLMDLANRHAKTQVMVEKAVDVMLAVDLVVMAERDEYDAAYILSADGDYTPAVQAARNMGKSVFAVSGSHGAQLAAAVNSFIHVDRSWFDDCYLP